MITPDCIAMLLNATTLGTVETGDISTARALPEGAANALKIPKTITKPKIGITEVGFVVAYQNKVMDTAPSPNRAHAKRILRSIRSARGPVNGARRNVGANSANPSNPRSNSLPVMS